MIRNTFIVLTLFTQTLMAFGRPALVVCVHQSGRSSIEYRWATCCEGRDDACGAPLGSEETPSAAPDEGCENEDPCTDSAWSTDEISSCTSTSIPLTAEATFALTLSDVPTALDHAVVCKNIWPTELPFALSPPTFLRTIVLIV